MTRRRRLDAELVRRELAPSRAFAQQLIAEGRVTVGGAPAAKAARMVDPGDPVEVAGDGPRFVSRGGEKLDAALDRFDVSVDGRRVIDAGSSTGGFTDCVLQRGAREVVAIDVGRNQLHERIRRDPRVMVYEQTNIRHTEPDQMGGPGDLVVTDLSFISIRTVAAHLVAWAQPAGDLVILVKPQFEAGKQEADRGRGVIRDPEVWRRTLDEATDAVSAAGAAIMGVMVSPITGGDGNVEFLAHARCGAAGLAADSWSAARNAAVADAEGR